MFQNAILSREKCLEEVLLQEAHSKDRLRQLEIINDIFLQNVAMRLQIAIKGNPRGFTFDLLDMRLKTKFMSGIYLVGQGGHGQIYKRVPALSKLKAWLNSN